MVNEFDPDKLSYLGFVVKEVNDEYCIIADKTNGNEVIIWKLGGWLQFRCNIFDIKSPIGSRAYISVLETINRLHDLALGARVAVSDTGEVVLISDVLYSTVNDSVVADMSNQLLFLSGKIISFLEDISRGRRSLSASEIDDIFSHGEDNS